MDLNSKIWIAIAAVTAALISAIISVVNMVISKDQKTTEFRQEWINSVRLEIAKVIALAKSIRSQRLIIQHLESHPQTKNDALDHISDAVKNHTRELNNSVTQLQLFLNPEEHKSLISLLDTLASISKVNSETTDEQLINQCTLVINESQKVLKKEWIIVKRGERTFILTKYIFVGLLILLSIVVALKIGGIIDVSFPTIKP